MIRNNPEVIYKGLLNRKANAARTGNFEKWKALDMYSWQFFKQVFGK